MPGVHVNPIGGCLEGIGQKEGEIYTKEGWCKHTALLDSASDLERLGHTAIEADCAQHGCMEGCDDTEECWWTVYPLSA